jgi:site-specific DNA-methyltransferase (adenine-specific)
MREVGDQSVHLVITSPPYWQLKDYGHKDQIGFDDTYEKYINNLSLVWNECHRVLHPGCKLCINIGDQFARSVYYGRYKIIPIRTEIIKFCETIGFDYMGAIIWQKVTTCNTSGGASIMGSYLTPRNGILKIDYEFILIFKKYGKDPKVESDVRVKSKLSPEEWNEYFSGHWNFAGEKQNGHLAMFPEELPKRLIKMYSFVGDTVLDPFTGSGTTNLSASNLNRNSIGYEINADFINVIKEKLKCSQGDVFNGAHVDFIVQENAHNTFDDKIKSLPYIFHDTVKIERKIDPKKMQFGSKIDNNSVEREEYFTVKEIISPELLKLSNDITIRLIGVKEDKELNGKAVDYLTRKIKGNKIFIKYDRDKYDENNNMMAYVYLKNKTFINAHLLKKGLVRVDTSREYKYINKFRLIENEKRD